jgi:hypothetical protein
LGCLCLAAGSAAKELPVQSMVVRAMSPSAHPLAATPRRVEIPFRPLSAGELQAARVRAHQQYLKSPQRTATVSPQTSLFQGLSWPGLSAIPAGGFTPPDGGAGIGPNAFIEAINSEIAVYNRATTATIASSSLATFTGGTSPCDPYVMWDNGAQRWVVVTIECSSDSSHTMYLDFTKSADPTDLSTGWCRYSIDSGSEFPDYPKAGHNSSDWLVGTNDFGTTSGNFDTSQLWAFEKPANGTVGTCPVLHVDTTSTAHQLKTVDGSVIFTPDASDQLDSGAPPSGAASDTGYFVAYEQPTTHGTTTDASEIDVIDFTRDASGAHFTAGGDIPITPYTFPGGVPQPGAAAGDLLDPSDTRGLGATSHVDPTRCSGCEAVWVEHAVDGPGGRSQIQWDEVNPAACTGAALCGSGALLQDGLLSSPSLFYWNPRISPDGFGNEAVMNFDAGSTTVLPRIMTVSNTPADAAGTTRDPVVIQQSSDPDDDFSCPSVSGSAGLCRWGDYAGAEADPLNPGVVWNNSMYTASAVDASHDPQWGTQNFAIRPAGPAASVTVSLAPSSVLANGTSQTVAEAALADPGGTPVQGDTVTFSSTDSADHIGPVSDNHDGTYTATITSSTTVGTPTITATDASVAPAVSGQAILTQASGPATSVGVRLSPSTILANGVSQSTATATVNDKQGHPIAGDHVSFSSTDSGEHVGPVSDNHDGTYTATITSSTTVGTPTITATDSSVSPPASGRTVLTQLSVPPPTPDVTNLRESNHTFRLGKSLAKVATGGSARGGRDPLAKSLDAKQVRLVDSELASFLGSELASLVGSVPATSVGRPAQPLVATDAKKKKKTPVGTVFSFALNTSAQVQLAFTQMLPGRKVGGKCVAQSGHNRRHAHCNRTVSRGSLSLSGHAGIDQVTFAGLVSPTKKLRPGNYKMTLTARNSTGSSRPDTISFTVVT